ncbi:MAG: sulfite exporter TauE/SafE family protein [Herminiimonas sp.]|nr:sulfite exporter TauE/SafE family protein [Herminiimonas sp.]
MNPIALIPVFLIGLLGSVHCVGMCGGIVGAFSSAPSAAPRRRFPVAVVSVTSAARLADLFDGGIRALAYNAGRLGSYAIAGAIAGGAVGGASTLTGLSTLQAGGYWLANLMLVALGLYLSGTWLGLARLESAGQAVWRRIQPLMKHLLPLDRWWKVLALGGLWGWLPCGMVYGVLVTAMFSGSAASGAAVMLAFGLGTLPMLLTLGLFGQQLRAWSRGRGVRLAGGLVILTFGLIGLARAAGGLPAPWLDTLCIGVPAPLSASAVLH